MGIPLAALGVPFIGLPPAGDRATQVETGTFTAPGVSIPIPMMGPFNIAIWASINTALTTTASSSTVTVASATGLAAGVAIVSTSLPRGSTLATLSGTSGTLTFPTYQLTGTTSISTQQYGFPVIKDLRRTTSLIGSTVSGLGIPANTTVTSIVRAYSAAGADGSLQTGIVQISNTPTVGAGTKDVPAVFSFALSNATVVGGTDANATFTGAGVSYTGSVQVERSFDGGITWIVANSGGGGSVAVFATGSPVNLAFGEPELGVLYRLNCTAYTSGTTINYRISSSGAATNALGYNQLT